MASSGPALASQGSPSSVRLSRRCCPHAEDLWGPPDRRRQPRRPPGRAPSPLVLGRRSTSSPPTSGAGSSLSPAAHHPALQRLRQGRSAWRGPDPPRCRSRRPHLRPQNSWLFWSWAWRAPQRRCRQALRSPWPDSPAWLARRVPSRPIGPLVARASSPSALLGPLRCSPCWPRPHRHRGRCPPRSGQLQPLRRHPPSPAGHGPCPPLRRRAELPLRCHVPPPPPPPLHRHRPRRCTCAGSCWRH
mmetsp:Transcript_7133/g.17134  ORF Transcript_7133/g.17134 Transcript_7133/m.17134 type:complete len:245 (-) Transcript_7133:1230-1964(-)